ncbi:hypothetical protein, partial [Lysobacter soli]|uniref:hypothetical protein n=1 Tax=Lysobacter soli TaxID=453783 RepID=UPI00240FEA43
APPRSGGSRQERTVLVTFAKTKVTRPSGRKLLLVILVFGVLRGRKGRIFNSTQASAKLPLASERVTFVSAKVTKTIRS